MLERHDIAVVFVLPLMVFMVFACRGDKQSPATPPAERRPNVLLITIDSLRHDHLGCYGYRRSTSPNLDRLAAEGAVFETAIAQAPWTLPSLASLLTSRLPAEVGAIHNDGRLAENAATAAQLFLSAGYATAAFTSGAYTDPSRGFARGFETYENRDRTHRAADLNRLALGWLDGNVKRPFFIWIHYFDVHADYAAPSPWNAMFDDTPPAPEVATIAWMMRSIAGGETLGAGDLDRIKTSYDREIAYTDAMLGELWRGLEQRRLAAGTALLVGADHGEGFLEHGLLLHTLSVFDEFVRVPLVLRLPGKVPAGIRVSAQVRNLDVLPTMLQLAGLDPLDGARGASLLPLLSPSIAAVPRPAPVHTDTTSHEIHYSRMGEIRPGLFDTFFAVRSEAFKLVYSSRQDSYRLFDLVADPGEQQDVAVERAHAKEKLLPLVEELRRIRPPADTARVRLSPDEVEQLRALGYMP